jgi:signal transduction histidine kinase
VTLRPRTLFGRLTLIIVGGLFAAQLLGGLLYLRERKLIVDQRVSHELAQRVAAAYRALDSQTGPQRLALAALLSTPRQQLTLATSVASPQGMPVGEHVLTATLRELLGQEVELHPIVLPHLGALSFALDLRLSDGEWLRVQGNAPEEIFASPLPLLLNLGVMLSTVFLLIWFAARSTLRPLTYLARAARELGEDLKRPPLPDTGPTEIRHAAQAFNAMQARLRLGIEERERFLAAVSHDLKTPVTRVRRRAELLRDAEVRERILHDMDEIECLVGNALDYLQGKLVEEPVQPIDLVAMIESLSDDVCAAGWEVSLRLPETLRFDGRPKALRRALCNLVDNAVKYGGQARIEVASVDGWLNVHVDDPGPGLAEAELARVFEPFYRVEGSRSRETGGTGLGLAIVRQIARSHGGDVHLENRKPAGLRAVMRLPIAPPAVRP